MDEGRWVAVKSVDVSHHVDASNRPSIIFKHRMTAMISLAISSRGQGCDRLLLCADHDLQFVLQLFHHGRLQPMQGQCCRHRVEIPKSMELVRIANYH